MQSKHYFKTLNSFDSYRVKMPILIFVFILFIMGGFVSLSLQLCEMNLLMQNLSKLKKNKPNCNTFLYMTFKISLIRAVMEMLL